MRKIRPRSEELWTLGVDGDLFTTSGRFVGLERGETELSAADFLFAGNNSV